MPDPDPLDAARNAYAAKRFEAAVELARQVVDGEGDGLAEARPLLANALFELGRRQLEEGHWDDGLPNLAEAAELRADAFEERRYGATTTLLTRLFRRRGGLHPVLAAFRRGEADAYSLFVSYHFARGYEAGYRPRRQELASRREAWQRRLTGTRAQPRLLVEGLALSCLAGDWHEADRCLEEIGGRKIPFRFDLDDYRLFLDLRSSDADSFKKAGGRAPWRESGLSAYEVSCWRGGAKPKQALDWARHGFERELAQPFLDVGVTASAAAEWLEIFSRSEPAIRWVRAGFDPEGCRKWLVKRAEPEVAASWRAAGFDAGEYSAYAHNAILKLDLEAARAWRSAGIATERTFSWLGVGIVDAKEAARLEKEGRTPADLRAASRPDPEVDRWRSAGFSAAERVAWQAATSDPETARQWRFSGFEAAAAGPWIASGASPQPAAIWRRLGFDAELAGELMAEQVRPQDGKLFSDAETREAWRQAGFVLGDAAPWARRAVSPEDAAYWRQTPWQLDEIVPLMRRVSARDAARFSASGVVDRAELDAWLRTGLEVDDAVAWHGEGFSANEAASARILDVELATAKLWRQQGHELSRVEAWRRAGVSLELATPATRAGYMPEQIRGMLDRGVDPAPFLEAGFRRPMALDWWGEEGFIPEQARPWAVRLFQPRRARQLAEQGLSPGELVPWDVTGPGWREDLPPELRSLDEQAQLGFVGLFVNSGYIPDWSFDESWPWLEHHFEGFTARAWVHDGWTLEIALRWRALGIESPKRVRDSIAEGWDLERLEHEARRRGEL